MITPFVYPPGKITSNAKLLHHIGGSKLYKIRVYITVVVFKTSLAFSNVVYLRNNMFSKATICY